MRQYNIWNRVFGQGTKTSADFGSQDGYQQEVLVGSGRSNSHLLCTVGVNREVDKQGRVHYKAHLDGKLVRHGIYEPTTGEFNQQELG